MKNSFIIKAFSVKKRGLSTFPLSLLLILLIFLYINYNHSSKINRVMQQSYKKIFSFFYKKPDSTALTKTVVVL